MDMRGFDPPQYDFMTFPGEEPSQTECNEDAGGQDTDECEIPVDAVARPRRAASSNSEEEHHDDRERR
jgi:hypothetical protein